MVVHSLREYAASQLNAIETIAQICFFRCWEPRVRLDCARDRVLIIVLLRLATRAMPTCMQSLEISAVRWNGSHLLQLRVQHCQYLMASTNPSMAGMRTLSRTCLTCYLVLSRFKELFGFYCIPAAALKASSLVIKRQIHCALGSLSVDWKVEPFLISCPRGQSQRGSNKTCHSTLVLRGVAMSIACA